MKWFVVGAIMSLVSELLPYIRTPCPPHCVDEQGRWILDLVRHHCGGVTGFFVSFLRYVKYTFLNVTDFITILMPQRSVTISDLFLKR